MLGKIIDHKRLELEKNFTSEYIDKIMNSLFLDKKGFKKSLLSDNRPALIGEIKKASPSCGIIRSDFDIKKIATEYDKADVSAISVLTEKNYFLGDPEYISKVKEITKKPVLRKDFIIDIRQVYESAYLMADAILLISSVLSLEDIILFKKTADTLGLDSVIEIHDEDELKKAIAADADIIGINNRDLKTFEVFIDTTLKLVNLIPKDVLCISESGIKTHDDYQIMKNAGIDALLVGETIMRSDSIIDSVKELKYGSQN